MTHRGGEPELAPPNRNKTIVVLAAVICRDGAYLVAKRPKHKRHGGLWEFPGGKLEPNESLGDAAIREIHEELNVDVRRIYQPMFTSQDPGAIFEIVFVPIDIVGEPSPVEHDELRWVDLGDLHRLDLAPSDRLFADFLHSLGST